MGIRGWRGLLDWSSLIAAIIPHNNLARVGSSNHQVGVEVGKAAGCNPAGAVEHVLWRVAFEVGVPYYDTVWV